MKLYVVPIVALISAYSVFGADAHTDISHDDCYTLSGGLFEKFLVPKSTFDASKKIFDNNGTEVVYGNVLCVKRHDFPRHYYDTREIWYQVEKMEDNDVIKVKLLSEQKLNDLSDGHKAALECIADETPKGFGDAETFTLHSSDGAWGDFIAPKNALLLCLLQGTRKSKSLDTLVFGLTNKEMSLLCVNRDNILSRPYFPAIDITLDDHEKTVYVSGLSQSIGLPEEHRYRSLETQSAALKALSDHIDKVYFNKQ